LDPRATSSLGEGPRPAPLKAFSISEMQRSVAMNYLIYLVGLVVVVVAVLSFVGIA
jgi:hypothetical protein